jgi:hypothetical protein
MKDNKAEQEKDRLAALQFDLSTKHTKYTFEVHDTSVVVTGKAGVSNIYAELEDEIREAGYTKESFRTQTGTHGTTRYLEDGRIQKIYFTREAK